MSSEKKIVYNLTEKDFERVFEFGINYYLGKPIHTGRTTGEPRGLGSVLDAFSIGKLTEIFVKRIIESLNQDKEVILDFSIKSTSAVTEDPDIIKVNENGNERLPNLFIEIKNTSDDDRWIGLTEKQLSSMKKGCKERQIFIIYSSISSYTNQKSPHSKDLLGMYLKKITNHAIFDEFSDLNAKAKLEFIISDQDLENFGIKCKKGSYMYETELFKGPVNIRKINGELRKNIKKISSKQNYKGKINIPLTDDSYDNEKSEFFIQGSFNIYRKQNPKTIRQYIECLSDVTIHNEIFGQFFLKKDNIYNFHLETIGRDPTLRRNNLFISKRRVYQLLKNGHLGDPVKKINYISDKI